jgi:hypothetical protein
MVNWMATILLLKIEKITSNYEMWRKGNVPFWLECKWCAIMEKSIYRILKK